MQRSYFKPYTISEEFPNMVVWFPQLSIDGSSIAKGWINVLSDDGKTIIESNDDNDISIKNAVSVENNKNIRRITFTKVQDPVLRVWEYRFVGIFKYSRRDDGKIYYEREIDVFRIIR
jgi:hypothetical protein